MKIFCTGASGYIGGSVAAHLIAAGHQVTGLVRSRDKADAVRARGIEPVLGTLDDGKILAQAAQAADVVVNAASADHRGAVESLLGALAGSGKPFIHTSGSSIVGTRAKGEALRRRSFDGDTPITPSPAASQRESPLRTSSSSPARDKGCRPVIVCTGPDLSHLAIGADPDSVQVPLLIRASPKSAATRRMPGRARTSGRTCISMTSCHSTRSPSRRRRQAASTSPRTASIRCAKPARQSTACSALPDRRAGDVDGGSRSRMGEGTTEDTMASNSRVRAKRAR